MKKYYWYLKPGRSIAGMLSKMEHGAKGGARKWQ